MRILSVTGLILIPATLWAHPGHGLDGGSDSPLHYLFEPQHLLGGLLVAAILAAWLAMARHRSKRRVGRR